MSPRSTLDPEAIPGPGSQRPPGHDARSLGPSDLSDTGSDSVGPGGYDAAILSDTGDSVGTGVDPSPVEPSDGDPGHDVGFDRVVRADEAGLGGGLDQAEEARYGVTDEMLDPVDEAGAPLDAVAGRAARARAHRRREDGPDGEEARVSDEGPDDAMLDEAAGVDEAREVDDPGDRGGDDADEPDAR